MKKSVELWEAAEVRSLSQIIAQFKKDYQKLLRNIPKIKTKQNRDTLVRAIEVFDQFIEKTFFDLSGKGSAFAQGMAKKARDKGARGVRARDYVAQDKYLREPAWSIHLALNEIKRVLRSYDDPAFKEFSPESREVAIKRARNRIGNYGRELERNWDQIVTSRSDPAWDVKVTLPKPVNHKMHGIRVVNYGHGKDNVAMLKRVNIALGIAKRKISARLPWLWKYIPVIKIDNLNPDYGGEYVPSSGGSDVEIRINNYWQPKVDELVWYITHEATHHLWRNALATEARRHWQNVFVSKQAKALLTTEYSSKNSEEAFTEFVTTMIVKGRRAVPIGGLKLLRHMLGGKLKESHMNLPEERRADLAEHRPSDCFGFIRVIPRNGGLDLYNENSERIGHVDGDRISEDAVAECIYRQMSIFYDVSPARSLSESRVVPALYRLIGKARRGEQYRPEAFAQVLSSLRPALSIQEAVRVPADRISVSLRDRVDEDHYILAYHYSWATKTPQTGAGLPNELSPFNQSMVDSVPQDDGRDIGYAPLQMDADGTIHYREEIRESASLIVDVGEGTVRIVGEGREEDVPLDATDEDLAARLLSVPQEKGLITASESPKHFLEGTIRVNRSTYCEAVETPYGMVFRRITGLPPPRNFPGLSLRLSESAPGLYFVECFGTPIGSVLRRRPRVWGYSRERLGPWLFEGKTVTSWHAATTLARSLRESIEDVIEDHRTSLEDMGEKDLRTLAQGYGVLTHGDGSTWEREKLIAAIEDKMEELKQDLQAG